jgi:VIT1/CCC1 family predicted Fe2+/Mn2+ transporter
MAAGEYVSVSSQTDIEQSDIEREKKELAEMPEAELKLLAAIYEKRGLKKQTAKIVAKELTEHDALAAHVRDELGLNEISKAKPIQAAISSCLAFISGGALPLVVVLTFPVQHLKYTLYVAALFFLILLGIVVAKTGGSSVFKAIIRISFWGTIAMGLTAWVGHLFKITI